MAQVTIDYLDSSPRYAETQLGWSRKAIANGLKELEELIINLDNGISHRSNRTQFIKRIVDFSIDSQLKIRLIYYPPYHSKYNSLERCWAVLENYGNGAILNTVFTAINWASNMTWKGKHPTVYLIEDTYDKGVTVPSSQLQFYQQFWQPSENLPKWDVTIVPP